MLQDTTKMNPKGRVKLEMYDEAGVFHTIEKKNLVVLQANKIIADLMADPSKTIRLSADHSSVTESSVHSVNGYYYIKLPINRDQTEAQAVDLGTTAVTEVPLPDAKKMTEIVKASIGTTSLVVGSDIFIKDAKEGIVGFGGAGQSGTLNITYERTVNPMQDIIEGTEVVELGGTPLQRGLTPDSTTTPETYAVDYKLGEIYFADQKTTALDITFDYEMDYTLGFMGVGGLPAGNTPGTPVSFPDSQKFLASMENEFGDARQPIQFPATIDDAKPEVDVLLAKEVDVISKTDSIVLADSGTDGPDNAFLDVSAIIDGSTVNRKVIYTLTATDNTGTTPISYTFGKIADGADIELIDPYTGEIAFNPASSWTLGNTIDFTYELRKNRDHLQYQLNYSPAVELMSVKFEDNAGIISNIKIGSYDGAGAEPTHGLEYGADGKVRIINVNAGIIEFHEDVEKVLKNTPGTFTIEYKVNSGTIVRFVADFPKGVPGPMLAEEQYLNTEPAGAATYTINPAIAEDPNNIGSYFIGNENGEIFVDGVATTDYTITDNGATLTLGSSVTLPANSLQFDYKKWKDSHDIYQVAMFDHKYQALSQMFNISGIGPVTKDKNTGMRVTWSVTF